MPPPHAFVFFGPDDFSVTEALAEVKAQLGPQDALMANTATLEGGTLSFQQFRLVCDSVPFLADYRLVLVKGLLERFELSGRRAAGKDGKDFGGWEALATYLPQLPPSTTLVILAGAISTANPLLRTLQGAAVIKSFTALNGRALHDWITQRAAELQGRFEPEAVSVLVDFLPGDLRLVDSEMQKLLTYAGARPVRAEDVRALVTSTREAGIFELVDAVVQGQTQAMRILERLFEQEAAPQYIITMLARQLRLMVQAKSAIESGVDDAELGEAMGTGSDYVVRKTKEQVRSYTLEALKRTYGRLLEVDLAIKSGTLEPELAMELFVAESGRSDVAHVPQRRA